MSINEFGFKGKDGCSYESPRHYVTSGILHLCHCGSPEMAEDAAWEILTAAATKRADTFEVIYMTALHEVLAKLLSHEGILEHGSSIGGSWLTPKGIDLCNEVGIEVRITW